MSDFPESRCPVCGTPGKLIQGDTLHYESLGTVPPDQAAERARLLEKAAPDLLAACKAALYPAGDTPEEVTAQLLAAIKKAEG